MSIARLDTTQTPSDPTLRSVSKGGKVVSPHGVGDVVLVRRPVKSKRDKPLWGAVAEISEVFGYSYRLKWLTMGFTLKDIIGSISKGCYAHR